MAQTIRPNAFVSESQTTGAYTDIDESVADDADFIRLKKTSSTTHYRMAMENPASTVGSGTSTLRVRAVNAQDGTPSVGTPFVTLGVSIYEGVVLIDSTTQVLTATLTTYSWTPDLSAVTNFNNLEVDLTQDAVANRNAYVTWLELELPDSTITGTMAATEAADTFAALGVGAVTITGTLAATETADTFASGTALSTTPQYGTANVCMRCGFRTKRSKLRKEWTGLRVCGPCYDPRPAELRSPRIRPEGLPKPGSSPEPEPVYGRTEVGDL